MNMLSTPACPGERLAFLLSSLTLAAVSQPQKKNTPRTVPAARPVIPWMDVGLNQEPEAAIDPAGCVVVTFTSAATANASTARYSIPTRSH